MSNFPLVPVPPCAVPVIPVSEAVPSNALPLRDAVPIPVSLSNVETVIVKSFVGDNPPKASP